MTIRSGRMATFTGPTQSVDPCSADEVERPQRDSARTPGAGAACVGVHQIGDPEEVGYIGIHRLLIDLDRRAHLGDLA